MDQDRQPQTSSGAATIPRRGRTQETRDLNPWWGEPPDIATAVQWRDVIQGEIEKIQNELADANQGLPVLEDDGTPVTPAGFAVWRRGKLNKRESRVTRLHYLKRWIEDHDTSDLTPGQRRAITKDRDVPVQSMFAAARRFEMLEELHDICRRMAEEDSDANWEAMLGQLDVLAQHGISEQ